MAAHLLPSEKKTPNQSITNFVPQHCNLKTETQGVAEVLKPFCRWYWIPALSNKNEKFSRNMLQKVIAEYRYLNMSFTAYRFKVGTEIWITALPSSSIVFNPWRGRSACPANKHMYAGNSRKNYVQADLGNHDQSGRVNTGPIYK